MFEFINHNYCTIDLDTIFQNHTHSYTDTQPDVNIYWPIHPGQRLEATKVEYDLNRTEQIQ